MRNSLSLFRPDTRWSFADFDQLFDRLLSPPMDEQKELINWFRPNVDVVESKDAYVISADLPGVKKDGIKIDVNEGRLTLSGERLSKHSEEDGQYKRFEKNYGKFERHFQLPAKIDEENIQASFEDGVLEIVIPKAETAKARTIQITDGQKKH